MARGGARAPKPGGLYPNRSDMRATQPISAVPGQTYGEAKKQEDAQRAIPMAGSATAALPQSSPPPVPGELGMSIFGPSTRPGEPVTHGAASGPGGGPEVLQAPTLNMNSVSSLLNQIATSADIPELADLAQHAASIGQ